MKKSTICEKLETIKLHLNSLVDGFNELDSLPSSDDINDYHFLAVITSNIRDQVDSLETLVRSVNAGAA